MTSDRSAELRLKSALLMLSVLIAVVGVVWTAAQLAPRPTDNEAPMAAMIPQGALFSIESSNFAELLRDWEHSPEQAAWLKSDDYGMFSRSRLFGRLSEARDQFAGAAGMSPDAAFLDEIAGTNSVFAWYDIGKLEFLYITRLPPGKAEQTRLLQSKSSFSLRQIGSSTFYIRTRASDGGGEVRTVAFATSGDYLLLATREDLMANALALIAHSSTDSLATEPWFVDAGKAVSTNTQAPSLRMALDLDRIVKTPYFRSYWVQQNVTEMKQYRAAVVDLYREPAQMREERALLPKTPSGPGASQADLGQLTALVPPQAAVYRAVATGDAAVAIAALDDKLLGRRASQYSDTRVAPSADLSEQATGSATDLETRIDAAPMAAIIPAEQMRLLRAQIAAAGIVGVLTVDSNDAGAMDAAAATASMWIPFHSGVVLRAARAWDESAIETALVEALEPRLSAGNLGLAWNRQSGGYASLGQIEPLQVAVRGNLLLITDDAKLMEAMLARTPPVTAASVEATSVGGFNHEASAVPFARLSALIDRVDTSTAQTSANQAEAGNTPAFFSGNLTGMSRTFAAMRSERVVERRDGPVVRQTVTYAWQR